MLQVKNKNNKLKKTAFSTIVFVQILFLYSCQKEEFTRVIGLTTDSVLINEPVIVSGTIIDLGTGITNYGHCWSESPNPNILNQSTQFTSFGNANSLLNYKSQITGLELDKTYYIRSYARNENEIEYGNELSLIFCYHTVNQDSVKIIDTIQANAYGSLQLLGNTSVEDFGHCWSISNETPTIDDSYNSLGFSSESITFTSEITNLKLGQKCYISAYSVYNQKISYSPPQTFRFGSVVFWNTLNSKEAVQNSKTGPSVQLTSYLINNWSQAKISKASFGEGLYINHDTLEGWKNDGGNFFAVDLSNTSLTPRQGTVEFLFEFKYNSKHNNMAYFFDMAKELTNHFENSYYHSNTYIAAGWNGWKFFDTGKSFFFIIGNEENNLFYKIETTQLPYISTDSLFFTSGTTMHFAFVWNVEGIDNSNETLRIYINGNIYASGSDTWKTENIFDPYLYIGAVPGYENRDHNFNAVPGIINDFKIYNYSETEFLQ